jgi:hypothetical protein
MGIFLDRLCLALELSTTTSRLGENIYLPQASEGSEVMIIRGINMSTLGRKVNQLINKESALQGLPPK